MKCQWLHFRIESWELNETTGVNEGKENREASESLGAVAQVN
jgi:hypothetical protein